MTDDQRKSEITRRVIELAAEQAAVPASQVVPQSHFINDLNFDSLDTMEFTMEIEDEFELAVPDEDVPTLDTVQKVVDYIASKTRDRENTSAPVK